jgi:hypothetical protein
LNLKVGKNQHRWKHSVDDRVQSVLEGAVEALDWAWYRDKESPRSFPSNTFNLFMQIVQQLQDEPKVQKSFKLPPLPPPPKRLSELVDEKTIRTIYEQQNAGTYREALKLAASGDRKASLAWRKILYAVEASYFINRYGEQAAPRPRVHFLHRELLKITDATDLKELTHQGIAEFLDDLCPCGKKHKADTIRKLRKRWSGTKKLIKD